VIPHPKTNRIQFDLDELPSQELLDLALELQRIKDDHDLSQWMIGKTVEEMVARYSELREQKDFFRADIMRQILNECGYSIIVKKDGDISLIKT